MFGLRFQNIGNSLNFDLALLADVGKVVGSGSWILAVAKKKNERFLCVSHLSSMRIALNLESWILNHLNYWLQRYSVWAVRGAKNKYRKNKQSKKSKNVLLREISGPYVGWFVSALTHGKWVWVVIIKIVGEVIIIDNDYVMSICSAFNLFTQRGKEIGEGGMFRTDVLVVELFSKKT